SALQWLLPVDRGVECGDESVDLGLDDVSDQSVLVAERAVRRRPRDSRLAGDIGQGGFSYAEVDEALQCGVDEFRRYRLGWRTRGHAAIIALVLKNKFVPMFHGGARCRAAP